MKVKNANPRLALAAAISWITAEQTQQQKQLNFHPTFIISCPSEGEMFTFELGISIKGTAAPLSRGDVGLLSLAFESTVGLRGHTFIYIDENI